MAAKPKAVKSPVAKLASKRSAPPAAPKTPLVSVTPVVKTAAPNKVPRSGGQTRPAQPDGGRAESGSMATTTPALKMKDLIDRVVTASGAKKADVRQIIEATLAALGDALSNGDALNLPPLGRAKVSRAADAGSGKAMTVKLRRPTAAAAGKAGAKQTLADTDD